MVGGEVEEGEIGRGEGLTISGMSINVQILGLDLMILSCLSAFDFTFVITRTWRLWTGKARVTHQASCVSF